MTSVAGGSIPPGLLEAFRAYERAFASASADDLDRSFDTDAIRIERAVVTRGAAAIAADRRSRPVAPPRPLGEIDVRVLGPNAAVIVARTLPAGGGSGVQTQVWRRGVEGWRIAVAQVLRPAPALDPAIWRTAGAPLVDARSAGALDQVGVAVKDLFAVAGHRVGAGVAAYLAEQTQAPEHASAVSRLLDAGAHLVGIATTDAFAYGIGGVDGPSGMPANAAAPGRIPGGSSSGPATAVASGQASLGLATDTAGSIRVPASFQGLWGLRTTHGLVDRAGVAALAPSFDTVGWLARDPGLIARALRATAEVDAEPQSMTVGEYVLIDELVELAVPHVAHEVRQWAAAYAPDARRAKVPDLDGAFAAFRTVQAAEAWREWGAWISAHPGALPPAVTERFTQASDVNADQEAAARRALTAARRRLDDLVGDAIVILPSAPDSAPAPARAADARSALLQLNALASWSGRPSTTVPALRAEDGAPVGVSLVGARGTDAHLLTVARGMASQ